MESKKKNAKPKDIIFYEGEKYIHEYYSKMLQEIIGKLEKELEEIKRTTN